MSANYSIPLDTFRDQLRRVGRVYEGDNGSVETMCPTCPGVLTGKADGNGGFVLTCTGCDGTQVANDLERLEPRVSDGDVQAQVVQLTATEAGQALSELLGLIPAGIVLRSAKVTGNGARASAQLELSNGEWMEFETLREMAQPTVLKAELAACAGVTPKLAAADALRAVSLLRQFARREQTASEDDHAVDWGLSFLQAAHARPVDMSDQADRWEAFSDLKSLDNGRDEADAGMTIVLVDEYGTRYVRGGHFYIWVRRREPGMSEGRIAQRMLRAGWTKRSDSGRIKASQPGFGGTLNWSFLLAPPGWPGNEVTASTGLTRARESVGEASRIEVVTGRYPVTSEVEG